MAIGQLIQSRKNLFTILSIFTIILAISILLFYFYRASQPVAVPLTGSEGETVATQEGGGIYLTLLLVIGGVTLVGVFIGVVLWMYNKTRSEFKYKNF